MLSLADARAIASFFPGARTVTVADARSGAIVWYRVFVRHWAALGVVIQSLYSDTHNGNAPCAVYVENGTDRSAVPSWLEELALTTEFRVFESGHAGVVTYDGKTVTAPPLRTSHSIIHFGGMEERKLNVRSLPVRISAQLPAHARLSRFRLAGTHPTESLPAPQWWQLDAQPGAVQLTVDVTPTESGDAWHVVVTDGEAIPIPEPNSLEPLHSLLLIFDRTCPDADRWSTARALVQGRRVIENKEYGTRADAGPSASEINAGIRQGLAKGLRDAAHTPFPVEVFWFADTSGDGLTCPTGVEMVNSSWGRLEAPVDSAALASSLEGLGYSPGLDLWDSLDEALAHAVAWMAGREAMPVLIVGNSPPHLPEEPSSEFWKILELPEIQSAYRRRSEFLCSLAKLEKLGVPVMCLFLTGHKAAEAGSAMDTYRLVQAAVRAGFQSCMPVLDAKAEESSVASVVVAALRRLNSSASRVIFFGSAESVP